MLVVAFSSRSELLGGYALSQLRFRGTEPVFLIALATLMITVQVIMVPLFPLVTNLGLDGSYWAVILPTAAGDGICADQRGAHDRAVVGVPALLCARLHQERDHVVRGVSNRSKEGKMSTDKNAPGFEYPDDPFDSDELVANDAVGGEPVTPTGHYGGPEGSEPLEVAPVHGEHDPTSDDGPTDLDGE